MNITHDITSNDDMDIDNQGTSSATNNESESQEKKIQTNSLLLANFPWFTVLPMVDNEIAPLLHKNRDLGYVC